MCKSTDLKINIKKTKLLKINTGNEDTITVEEKPVEAVESFTYLGSIVDQKGGTESDVKSRIGKARAAFIILKKLWQSKTVKLATKLRIFNTNVKSILLYGAETWRATKGIISRIQTFINNCLRRILKTKWQDKTTNEEIWRRTGQERIDTEIMRRRWRWIGHTLRKPASCTTRQALSWNPQGKRKRGCPRRSWRRSVKEDMKREGYT